MKKISTYALMFALVVSLGFASAAHAADTASTDDQMTITAVPSFSFANNLTLGSTGNDVLQLQKFLNQTPATQVAAVPFAGSAGKETSAFGPKTAAAVMVFQKANNIPATGIVGPLTRAAMNKMLTTVTVPEAQAPTVSALQVNMSTPGSATVSANYDGKGLNPTIWFAYGASPSSMTILSAKVVSDKTAGSSTVTISDLGTGVCYAAMFAQTSAGTVNTGPTACSK